MITLKLVLFILAFVCLALAAVNVPAAPRVNLLALGLALWLLAVIVTV
jgi:hypothetical protein